jgi:hypothetical protein
MATVALDRAGTRLLAETTTDRELIRSILERDRLFAAYALADLEDRDAGRAKWGDRASRRRRGLARPRVRRAGAPASVHRRARRRVEAILRDVIRPSIAYVACLPANQAAVERRYRLEPGPQMVRMWVTRDTFHDAYDPGVERLMPTDAGELNRLYRLGFGSCCRRRPSPRACTTGSG